MMRVQERSIPLSTLYWGYWYWITKCTTKVTVRNKDIGLIIKKETNISLSEELEKMSMKKRIVVL